MIPPFVIPERSPYFVSKSKLGAAQANLLKNLLPLFLHPSCQPQLSLNALPIIPPVPLHG